MNEKMVYVVSNPAWEGRYKVGVASDWKKRWQSYQTSSPYRDYKFEYGVTTENWKFIEKAVHNSFPGTHEWIQADLQDVKNLINKLK